VGNLLSLTDPENNETAWQYDSLDRVTSERNMLGYERVFQYDAVGNLDRRTDRNGRLIDYNYDRLDWNISEGWLVSAQVQSPIRVYQFQYDLAERMTESKDPDHHYHEYTYDALNRLTSRKQSITG
jgi:YD repeat-containing protein